MQFSNNDIEKSGKPIKRLRLPLFLRASGVVLLLAGLLVGVAGAFFWKQHQKILFEEKLRSVEHILDFLASGVKIPLLADDTLRLSSVVRDAANLEGIIYASVIDRNQVVQAYSGQEGFEEKRSLLEGGEVVGKNNGTLIVQYAHPLLGQVNDLSKIIMYNEKPFGTVHLGMSARLTEESLDAARSSLFKPFLLPILGVILVLLFIVFLYTLRVKQRISRLIRAADKYGNGNLQYRIENIENNESGDVARALHHMSQRLLSREPSQAQLEHYLKFSSLDRIMESPNSQSETHAFRRQVAVLFAGIKGFGSYAGTGNPEEIVKALNKYISIVTRIISKHGGYVDKVIGDAVVAIFGVSLYREGHTGRAVAAALELQEALSVGNKNESQLLSNVCVGIRSGIVLSGNIGSHSKVEYSSIGESIKEAYWLSNIGHPGEIILGEEIYNLMKNSVRAEALPPQKVFGSSDAINSFRLLSLTEQKNEPE